jgi:Ribonuclease G/E
MTLETILKDDRKIKEFKENETIKVVLEKLKGNLSDDDLTIIIGKIAGGAEDEEFLRQCSRLNKKAELGLTCCQNYCG